MTVKDLSVVDCKRVAEFFKSAFDDGWTESMLLSAFNSGRFNAVGAFDGDKLIGVITFSLSIDTADIEDIAVDIAYRKNGVGSLLVDYALKNLSDRGITKVFLEVRAGNTPAINLYTKYGFKALSVRKKYYDDGEDAIVMVKE